MRGFACVWKCNIDVIPDDLGTYMNIQPVYRPIPLLTIFNQAIK